MTLETITRTKAKGDEGEQVEEFQPGNKENKTESRKEEGKKKSAFEINIEKSAKQFRRTKEISRINTKEDRLEEEKLKRGEKEGREK